MAREDILTRTKKKRARAFFHNNQLTEAEELYAQIAKVHQRDLEAWQLLGTISHRLKRFDEAEERFRTALSVSPNHHEIHHQLGCVLLAKRQRLEAIRLFEIAINLKPNFFEPYVMLGNAYTWEGNLEAAAKAYERAIKLNPNHPVPVANLGNVRMDQGNGDDAAACWRRALAIRPDFAAAHSNLLLSLNYSNNDPEDMFKAHLQWARRHEIPVSGHQRHPNSRDAERRLRIGYVTADLRDHSVAYFLEPLLTHHNRHRHEIFCYSDVAVPDGTTRRLQAMADQYRSTNSLSDGQLAECVRNDRIDILIDLAGHTSSNRLLAFARRPAPIQVTYLGYPNTTGMAAIDYRLTDDCADPLNSTDALYTETLVRLPHGFLCYAPPADAPPVGPLPLRATGKVTFGAFNYAGKITPEVISVWAEILHTVPESTLIMKYRCFSDQATRQRYQELFDKHGISGDRLELLGLTASKSEHLAVYNRVDIALDTFPYNGTTTTCDTLWMGVPVVVLAGKVHAGRVGVSLLSRLGLRHLIAGTKQEYIAHAVRLTRDPDYLAQMRDSLRQRMRQSRLCNGEAFTRDVEQAYRTMWRRWCTR